MFLSSRTARLGSSMAAVSRVPLPWPQAGQQRYLGLGQAAAGHLDSKVRMDMALLGEKVFLKKLGSTDFNFL